MSVAMMGSGGISGGKNFKAICVCRDQHTTQWGTTPDQLFTTSGGHRCADVSLSFASGKDAIVVTAMLSHLEDGGTVGDIVNTINISNCSSYTKLGDYRMYDAYCKDVHVTAFQVKGVTSNTHITYHDCDKDGLSHSTVLVFY